MNRSAGMAIAAFLVGNIATSVVVLTLFPGLESWDYSAAIYIVGGVVAVVGYWTWADPKRREDKKPQKSDLF